MRLRHERRCQTLLKPWDRRSLLKGAGALAFSSVLPSGARAQNKSQVLVIGAGLSGLNAALILEELGIDVQVIEGRQRAGGRVYSLYDLPVHRMRAGQALVEAMAACSMPQTGSASRFVISWTVYPT